MIRAFCVENLRLKKFYKRSRRLSSDLSNIGCLYSVLHQQLLQVTKSCCVVQWFWRPTLPLPRPSLWLGCGCVSCFECAALEKCQASKAAVGFPRRLSCWLMIGHHLTAFLSVFNLPYREARLPRGPSSSSCFHSHRLQSVIGR